MRRTNVPALLNKYPEEEDDKEGPCPEPSVRRKWGRLVEVCLIYLKQKCQLRHHSLSLSDHIHVGAVTSAPTLPQKGSAPAPSNPSRVSCSGKQSFIKSCKGLQISRALNRRGRKVSVVGAKKRLDQNYSLASSRSGQDNAAYGELLRYSWQNHSHVQCPECGCVAISTCFRLKTADRVCADDEGPPSTLGWGRLNPS